MNPKIKKFKNYKDPYVIVVGDKEVGNNTVNVNVRGSKMQLADIPLDKFVAACEKMNTEHSLELMATAEEFLK